MFIITESLFCDRQCSLVDFYIQGMHKVFLSNVIITVHTQGQWFADVNLIIECSSVDVASLLCCLTSCILVEWSEYQLE